ncbi:MAG: nitroreductase family protein [Firmicutes bacterium]|nr:nitroreductase family protein [Bacillota bacterium]
MELNYVLKKRRSIRKFIEKEIPQEIIREIIESGLIAPSAHNRQPWKVKIVKEDKNKIVGYMRQYGNKNQEDISILKTADTIERCNTLLLIYCDNFEQYEYNLLSIGAMIENILLTATDKNIASVWIANVCPIESYINQLFKIDSSQNKLVSAVALGYSDVIPKEIVRKQMQDILL